MTHVCLTIPPGCYLQLLDIAAYALMLDVTVSSSCVPLPYPPRMTHLSSSHEMQHHAKQI